MKFFHIFGASYFIYIIGAALGFLQQFLLTHIMVTKEFGIFTYVYSCLVILSLLPRFGFDASLIRYLGEYSEKRQWQLFRGCFQKCINISSYILIAILILIYIVLFINGDENLGTAFFIGSLALPFMVFIRLYHSSIRTLGFPLKATLLNLILTPIIFIILSYIISLKSAPSAELLLWTHCISLFFSYLLFANLFRKIMATKPNPKCYVYRTKEWIRTSLSLFFMSGFNIIINRLDIIMIGLLLTTELSGIYAIGSLIATTVAFGLSALNNILAPRIAALYHSGKINELQLEIINFMKLVVTVTTPVFIILIVFGENILLLFGEDFKLAYCSLVILTIGQVVAALSGCAGNVINMTGHHNIGLKFSSLTLIINISLNWLLIPMFGIQGAAVATSTALIIRNILMIIYVKNNIGIDTTALSILNCSTINKRTMNQH